MNCYRCGLEPVYSQIKVTLYRPQQMPFNYDLSDLCKKCQTKFDRILYYFKMQKYMEQTQRPIIEVISIGRDIENNIPVNIVCKKYNVDKATAYRYREVVYPNTKKVRNVKYLYRKPISKLKPPFKLPEGW